MVKLAKILRVDVSERQKITDRLGSYPVKLLQAEDDIEMAQSSLGRAFDAHESDPSSANARALTDARSKLAEAKTRREDLLVAQARAQQELSDHDHAGRVEARNEVLANIEHTLSATVKDAQEIEELTAKLADAIQRLRDRRERANQTSVILPLWAKCHWRQVLPLIQNQFHRASVGLMERAAGWTNAEQFALPGSAPSDLHLKLNPAGEKPLSDIIRDLNTAVMDHLRSNKSAEPALPPPATKSATAKPVVAPTEAVAPASQTKGEDYSNWKPAPAQPITLPKV